MIVPTLRQGRTARVWSPSSQSAHLYPRRLQRGLQALGTVLNTPVDTVLPREVDTGFRHPRTLAAIAEEAATDDRVGVLAATSGGWTSLALLPHLDIKLLVAHPIVYLGHSDLTVLLNVITATTDVITYLGPNMLASMGEYGGPWELTARSLSRALYATPGQTWILEHADTWSDELLGWDQQDNRRRHGQSHPEDARVVRAGTGAGRLWGGSLRSIRLLAGTPYWPAPTVPSIIMIDDERLSPDELFALLTSIGWAGAFDSCAAVLVGKHSRPRPNPTGYGDHDEALLTAIPPEIPIVAGLDIGHTEPVHTMPLGATVEVFAAEPDCRPLVTVTLNG